MSALHPPFPEAVNTLIELAIAEDIGDGDVTCRYFVLSDARSTAAVVARETGIVAGLEICAEIFRRIDPALTLEIRAKDGDTVASGQQVMLVNGLARSILTAERTALNFLQRLSGVATAARHFVDAIAGTKCRLLDTRKTTPGLRVLEKAAVAAGGGTNHRTGLFDMAMVKDNHLLAPGAVSHLQESIWALRSKRPGLRIELEADTLEQVESFLQLDGVDVILLDNMPPAKLREAVAMRKGSILFEASGGIHLENAHEMAATGVDFISVGAVTHSARALDFSLDFRGADA